MNKTEDIEQVVKIWLSGGPLTVEAICDRFRRALPGEQLTWLGIAMHRLEDDGRIRFPNCQCGSHEGDCVAEWAS